MALRPYRPRLARSQDSATAAEALPDKATLPPDPVPAVSDDPSVADSPLPAGLPQHVAATLAQAGERAAQRLLEILTSKAFERYRPSEQRALIELALTRAYGLPVRREVSVSLTSDDSDAVAASLAQLAGRPLPEYAQPATQRHAGRRSDTVGGGDS